MRSASSLTVCCASRAVIRHRSPVSNENAFVPAGEFGSRTLESLLEEFAAVRAATIALVAGLPDDAWSRSGTASDAGVSARAIACSLSGHELHDRKILVSRSFS